MPLRARVQAAAGLALLGGMLVLGWLALTPQVTHDDLRVDQALVPLRLHLATTVFLALTRAAQEPVGLAALAAGVLVLAARRRRLDAARLLGVCGAAWLLALAEKHLVNRPRPPARLWLLRPDPTGSFPSGHATTAALLVLIAAMALAGTGAARALATTAALAFALAVGASRLYLGDHYPTDVLASYLTVAAAALLVCAVTNLPRVRQLAAGLMHTPTPTSPPPPPGSPEPAPTSGARAVGEVGCWPGGPHGHDHDQHGRRAS